MKIAMTGANGRVGDALTKELSPKQFDITPLDLPEFDAANFADLVMRTRGHGHEALIHLAWAVGRDNYQSANFDTQNMQMVFDAYRAARLNGIRRVIMASSIHAHRADMPDNDGKIHPTQTPWPDSPHGAGKVFAEGMGRFFAREHGLEVICLRIGELNDGDKSSGETPANWISHADLGRLVTACLLAPPVPDNFEIVYAVGRQDLYDTGNSFGWQPHDSA